MKTCFKCGLEKPTTEFYSHPSMGDGLLGKCKKCTKADTRANYALRREQYREYDRLRQGDPARRARKLDYQTSHRARNPEKYSARTLVGSAVKCGRLERKPCEVCGDPNAEAHHGDYSRPLDVRWLCLLHHRQEHGRSVA